MSFAWPSLDQMVDPEVVAKMEEVRKAKGVVPRAVSDEEICERCGASISCSKSSFRLAFLIPFTYQALDVV